MQTFMTRNAIPGKAIEFSISGTGSFPREDQTAQGNAGDNGGQEAGGQSAGGTGNQPGGGIGAPINTPDPLSKYKWWILGVWLCCWRPRRHFCCAGRRWRGSNAGRSGHDGRFNVFAPSAAPEAKSSALLSVLKEELFALESEKVAGTLAPNEYAEQKAALETVLKRALKKVIGGQLP